MLLCKYNGHSEIQFKERLSLNEIYSTSCWLHLNHIFYKETETVRRIFQVSRFAV